MSNDPKAKNPITRASIITLSSLSHKSVLLYDWWLVKAEGNGLAVAGFASERIGARMFCSAAIVKRHNTTTLEAKDGIVITISGLINHSRTHQNGFPFHVCTRFRMGFPYGWEEYATKGCSDDFVEPDKSSGASANTSPLVSLEDLPITRMQDLFLYPLGDPKHFVDDILGQFCNPPFEDTQVLAHADLGNKTPVRSANCMLDKTPRKHKKVRASKGSKDMGETWDMSGIITEQCITPSRGVVTRSMASKPMSAPSGLQNKPPVRTANRAVDKTPSKLKKAKSGKKSRDVEQRASSSRGVVTRSMSRWMNFRKKLKMFH